MLQVVTKLPSSFHRISWRHSQEYGKRVGDSNYSMEIGHVKAFLEKSSQQPIVGISGEQMLPVARKLTSLHAGGFPQFD